MTVAPAGLLDRDEETLACDGRDVDPLVAILNSGVAYLWWKAWGGGFHVKAATYTALPDLRSLVPSRKLANLSKALRDAMGGGERRVGQSGTGGGRLTEIFGRRRGDVLERVDAALLDGLGLQGRRHETALAIERLRNSTLIESRASPMIEWAHDDAPFPAVRGAHCQIRHRGAFARPPNP